MRQGQKAAGIGRPPAARNENASEKFTSYQFLVELLLVSDRTVRRWVGGKKLKSHQFGAARRIASSELIVFIERARRGGAALRARNPLDDTFYTVENVAKLLNVCVRTVRRRIDSGVLVAHDFFGIIRIADSDLHDFIDRSRRE
jgi:excisionase family DNA binding protein